MLSDDYFDARAVNDEDIKRITAVLTLVGGQIVHSNPDGQ